MTDSLKNVDTCAVAERTEQEWQKFDRLAEMQCENMEAALNSPWVGELPAGSSSQADAAANPFDEFRKRFSELPE